MKSVVNSRETAGSTSIIDRENTLFIQWSIIYKDTLYREETRVSLSRDAVEIFKLSMSLNFPSSISI